MRTEERNGNSRIENDISKRFSLYQSYFIFFVLLKSSCEIKFKRICGNLLVKLNSNEFIDQWNITSYLPLFSRS